MAVTIRLPSNVYDDTIPSFLAYLAPGNDSQELEVDFQDVAFYVPSALTILLSIFYDWGVRGGKKIVLSNLEAAPALGYLQRMDFLRLSGIPLVEKFQRHDSANRFVPLCRIDDNARGNVASLCANIAGCVFPELSDSDDPDVAGPYDLLEYTSSELVNNVIQHAKGVGFAAAQVYPKSSLVRLAVADCGVGILKRFEEDGAPFWDQKMSDLDAVRTAIQPRVSSKLHLASGWSTGGVNAGVGLSMLKQIAQCADGMFTLVSGQGFYQHNYFDQRSFPSELNLSNPFRGTVCAVEVRKQKLGNIQLLLQNAKKELGLLDSSTQFDSLFQ